MPRSARRTPALVTGAEVAGALARCDVVVRSPGVSTHRPELREVRAAGTPVTTATALWLAERGGRRVVGVTGTKGKSTTAALLAHLARAGGEAVGLAGNIGAPALDLLDHPPAEWAVVELSSYHTADLQTGPEVAVVTNLFREHTDWHGSEEAYRADKLRLLGLPGVRAAVLPAGAASLLDAVGPGVAPTLYGQRDGWDAGPTGLTLSGELVVAAAELPLRGRHNALNLCAALTALAAAGLATPRLPDALRDFRALPHRLEVVAERERVVWVDDSISTTPESTLAALASFAERTVVLVAGGQDRGQDYAELGRALAARGRRAVLLQAAPTTGPRLGWPRRCRSRASRRRARWRRPAWRRPSPGRGSSPGSRVRGSAPSRAPWCCSPRPPPPTTPTATSRSAALTSRRLPPRAHDKNI